MHVTLGCIQLANRLSASVCVSIIARIFMHYRRCGATASFAISWFAEHKVGIALATKPTGARFGSLLAFLVPSNLFVSLPLNDSFSSLNHSSSSSEK